MKKNVQERIKELMSESDRRLLEKSIEQLTADPNAKSDLYFCLIPADPSYKTAFGIGRKEYYGRYTSSQNGYKQALYAHPILFHECRYCGAHISESK